jgi:hypothetical protein
MNEFLLLAVIMILCRHLFIAVFSCQVPVQPPLPLYPLSAPQTLNVSSDHPASIR